MGCYRIGRKLGRTIYWQPGAEPTDNDDFIGIMDQPGIARYIVTVLNADLERTTPRPSPLTAKLTAGPLATHEEILGGKVYVSEALREDLRGDQ
jgi:hypothetical protein